MHRRSLAACHCMLAAAAIAACAGTAGRVRPGAPQATGTSGAAGARTWQPLPDVSALRAEYARRDDFSRRCEHDRPLRAAFRELGASDWPELLATATRWLDACPVDIDFHLLRSIALGELGRPAEAMQHAHWYHALVASVLDSGDGRTPATAWVVISVAEEYALLRALGMREQRQTLVDGHIDAIEVESEGRTQTLYFDPATHFERLERGTQR